MQLAERSQQSFEEFEMHCDFLRRFLVLVEDVPFPFLPPDPACRFVLAFRCGCDPWSAERLKLDQLLDQGSHACTSCQGINVKYRSEVKLSQRLVLRGATGLRQRDFLLV